MRYHGKVKQNDLPMNCNPTQNYTESISDQNLFADIKAAFAEESESQGPSASVLQYIKAFAAAFETVNTGLIGKVDLMNN